MNSHTRIIKKMASPSSDLSVTRAYHILDSVGFDNLPDWLVDRVTRASDGTFIYMTDTGHELPIPHGWVVIQGLDFETFPLVISRIRFQHNWLTSEIEEVSEPLAMEQHKKLIRVSLYAGDELGQGAAEVALVSWDKDSSMAVLMERVIQYLEAGAPLAMPKFIISDESQVEDIDRLASEAMTGQIIPVSESQLQAFVTRKRIPVNDPLDPPVMNMAEYQRLTRELAYHKTQAAGLLDELTKVRAELESVRKKEHSHGEAFLKHLFEVIHVAADGITEDFIKRIEEEIAIGAAEGFASESTGGPGHDEGGPDSAGG